MSLSRDFAAFVANLRYADLPPAVADRTKGVTLEALTSALVAHEMPASKQALALMQDEEQGGAGIATVLCSGAKLTKAGAAFVNAETVLAGPPSCVFGPHGICKTFKRAITALLSFLSCSSRPFCSTNPTATSS